jgi:hypothetical protein
MVLAAHGGRAALRPTVRPARSGIVLEQAVTGAMGLSFWRCLLLRHRGDTRSPFSSPLGGVGWRRWRAVVMTFSWSLTMVRTLSSAPSASPVRCESSSQPPLGSHVVESTWAMAKSRAWWLIGLDISFGPWPKSELKVALFIGVLIPTHRGLDILTNLSPNRLWITVDKKDLAWGINSVSTKNVNGHELRLRIGLATYRVRLNVNRSDFLR